MTPRSSTMGPHVFGFDMSTMRSVSSEELDHFEHCPPPIKTFSIDDLFAHPTFPTRSTAVHVKNGGVSLLLGLSMEPKTQIPMFTGDSHSAKEPTEPKIKWAHTLEEYCSPYEPFDWKEFDESEQVVYDQADYHGLDMSSSPEPSYKIIVDQSQQPTSILKL